MTANDNEKQVLDTLMPAVAAHTGFKSYDAFFAYEQRADAAHRMAKRAQESSKNRTNGAKKRKNFKG